jgi:hypothetical protein
MKRFVQTFVLTPADNSKQKYYVHNDIFRYQDSPIIDNKIETPITPLATNTNIEFFDNTIIETKKDEKSELNNSSMENITPPVTPVVEQTKPKSYRDAIGKKEKSTTNLNNENQSVVTGTKTNKSNKQQKKAAKANANNNNRTTRGHPQDANDYYDDSWYYGNGDEGYLSTGYTDDQEVFVGNLSAQVTENEVEE